MKIEPVETVLREGRCTPNCLLALGDESKKCSCRCHGAYHSALADHQVIANRTIWNWYEPDDVVYLRKDEYAKILEGPDPYADYNRAYRQSYGKFQCVVREASGKYSVVFDHYQHGVARYDLKEWDRLCHWIDLLLLSNVISGCTYPTNPDHEEICGSKCYFEFRVWGIKDKNTAIVIQDTVSNYVYACDYGDRLGKYIENLEEYLSALGEYEWPETHLSEEQLFNLDHPRKHCHVKLVSLKDIPTRSLREKGPYCLDPTM